MTTTVARDSAAYREVWGESTFVHTGFVTKDLDASIRFWTEVMGFEAKPVGERRMPWLGKFIGIPGAAARLVHLHGHGGCIEFIEFLSQAAEEIVSRVNGPGTPHVCLRVKNVARLQRNILAAGGSLQGELTEVSEGTAIGLRGLYMRDPHGILIELIELPRDSEG